jgi:hypothetical protein
MSNCGVEFRSSTGASLAQKLRTDDTERGSKQLLEVGTMFTTLRFLHGSNGRSSPRDMAHDFVVKALPKPRFMAPRPYEYHCIRCGWSFIFNSPKGCVTALNHHRVPLGEPDNTARSRTFASGPCPALANLAQLAAVPKSNHHPMAAQEALRPRYPLVLRPPACPPTSNDAAPEAFAKARS